MKILMTLALIVMVNSCATRIDKSNPKAVRNNFNGDIVWKHKVYQQDWFTSKYKADELFLDDKQSQNKIIEANKLQDRANTFLWSGVIGAVGFLFLVSPKTDLSITEKSNIYWGIFGTGFVLGLYHNIKGNMTVEEAIKDYNQRKGYSFAPLIYRQNKVSRLGLAFNSSF